MTVATQRQPHRHRLRMAHWRAGVLIGVHLLIAAHLLHGWWAGETFGRVVLADAQATLQHGVVNPGFLLFALALLATALCGRFFCGWACHMGALQDACAWLLRRLRIRPRPFRSRLLGYAPLLLALYLFVWPSLQQAWALPPDAWPDAAEQALGAWHVEWRSRDLWAGMPGPWVALPFLLLCGGATVYFLGARGLCRYACPYGGLLRPVERLAPLRVVVDPDLCDQCARCTAACSMQIRVHELTREHGAVIDPDCMRTLDCIEACPTQALALRPVLPPLWRAAEQSAGERIGLIDELLVAAVALAVCALTRGLYGAIPLLLAATLGVLTGFVAWKTLQILRQPDARMHTLPLRRQRRLTGAGRGWLLLVVVGCLLLLQGAAVRLSLWQADRLDRAVVVGWDAVAARQVEPPQRAAAVAALRWYTLASPLGSGGIAALTTPEVPLRRAWMQLVLGDSASAESTLRAELARVDGDEAVLLELAQVLLLRADTDGAIDLLQAAVAVQPTLAAASELLFTLLIERGDSAAAEQMRARHLQAVEAAARSR